MASQSLSRDKACFNGALAVPSVITTKSVIDQVLIFLLISSLLLSRLARARLLRRALI